MHQINFFFCYRCKSVYNFQVISKGPVVQKAISLWILLFLVAKWYIDKSLRLLKILMFHFSFLQIVKLYKIRVSWIK